MASNTALISTDSEKNLFFVKDEGVVDAQVDQRRSFKIWWSGRASIHKPST